jgi:hypothetical protein
MCSGICTIEKRYFLFFTFLFPSFPFSLLKASFVQVGPVQCCFRDFVEDLVEQFLTVVDSGVIRVAMRIPVSDYIEVVDLMAKKVKRCFSHSSSVHPSMDVGMRPITNLVDMLGNFEIHS